MCCCNMFIFFLFFSFTNGKTLLQPFSLAEVRWCKTFLGGLEKRSRRVDSWARVGVSVYLAGVQSGLTPPALASGKRPFWKRVFCLLLLTPLVVIGTGVVLGRGEGRAILLTTVFYLYFYGRLQGYINGWFLIFHACFVEKREALLCSHKIFDFCFHMSIQYACCIIVSLLLINASYLFLQFEATGFSAWYC